LKAARSAAFKIFSVSLKTALCAQTQKEYEHQRFALMLIFFDLKTLKALLCNAFNVFSSSLKK